jgi:endonuclease G
MQDFERMKGYSPDFLGPGFYVNLPQIPQELAQYIAPLKNDEGYVLDYHNYSIIQHAERRLPIFTASNIHGKKMKELSRKSIFPSGRDRWLKDERIDYSHQWGSELYSAKAYDFDKGHMVKREDVQWGKDDDDAREAAQSTFFYTNSAPQHAKVNRSIWLRLENFILHEETVGEELKVIVMTGPVLQPNDPIFVVEVREQEVRLPTLFWKVIYFVKGGVELTHVAFLVGQQGVLEKNGITHPKVTERGVESYDDLFMNFEEADTYQVNVSFVEKLTGLSFPQATDPFVDDRPSKLAIQEVNVRSLDGSGGTDFILEGVTI